MSGNAPYSPAAASREQLASLWRRAVASDFVRKVAETYLSRIALVVVGLTTSVLVARALGPEGRGVFAVAGAAAAMGVQLGNLGLHTANTYLVGRDRSLLPALVGNTLALSAAAGLGIALLSGAVFAVRPPLAPVGGAILWLALASIPVGLGGLLLQNILLGIQEVRAYNAIEVGTKLAIVVLFGAIVLFGAATAVTAFATVLLVQAAGVAVAYGRLRRDLPGPPVLSGSVFKEAAGYGLKSYVSSFLHVLMLRADLLMVKYMLGAEEAGQYSIAAGLADQLYLLPAVIGMILFPKLTALETVKEKWDLTNRVTVVVLCIMVALGGLSVFLAKPVVALLYGRPFLPAATAFVWLVPGLVFYGSTFSTMFLMSVGQPIGVLYIWFVVVALNLGLNYLVIPVHGIVGAAAVSSVTYTLCFILYSIYAWRYYRGR